MLTEEERWLRRTLKHLVLGLASLERTIMRQRSRLRWLQEGDANSKLFHLVANGRKLKNFIHAISVVGITITDQATNEEAFLRHTVSRWELWATRAHVGFGISGHRAN